ncbi:MAG: DNA polymerase III subunit beta [SAR202 cluster bacterium]|nr:DNA polymerase III subunit beta [SAR202 cluster bacterium]
MRLSCLQENLSRGLSIVGRAVATRTTLPITQNVLLASDQGRLKLSATNLEIAISTWIGAQTEEPGEITVPARLLTEFVSSLPAERIDFKAVKQPLSLEVSCARFKAQINGSDAEDFPPVPTVESGVAGKVEAQALRDAIAHVVFAAATEDSRPVLTGIKVEMSGDQFTFAAADGFRLAVYKGKLMEPIDQAVSFIVPARTLQEVSRLAGGQSEFIQFIVTPSKSQALFRLDNIEIVTQLVQGTFPNYSQLIPQSFDSRAVVGLSDFVRATRAASIFARDGSGIVRIQVTSGDGGRVSVLSRSEEVGENKGEIDAKVEGNESKIAFNSKYLADVLGVLQSSEVALETTTPSSPGVIKPVGNDKYVHVVMPMFVQW